MSTSLSPFKMFQRSPNAALATQAAEPDPLMDPIKANKLSENYVSTLKFIHEKKDVTPAADAETEAQAVAVVLPAVASPEIKTQVPKTVQAAAPAPVATQSSHMAERMQRFKNRLQVERNSQGKIPFTDTTQFQRFVFETKPSANAATNPVLWVISDYLEKASAKKTEPAFRKTSVYESLLEVFEHQSGAIFTAASFTLTLEPADGFEFNNGGCDLFINDETPAFFKAVEEDSHFTLNIPRADRLAINDVTLSHSLRKRGVSADSFSGWFEEDGFACAVGISPIETFVQSQVVHLHHQSQRTFNQLRRLALHLQTHCANIAPSACMENAEQAQVYFEQFGETPNPSLYRLLECECLLEGDTSKTLYEVFCESQATPLTHKQVVWPGEPMSLGMLRLLANIAENHDLESNALRFLAVFDQLIREPKNEEVSRAHIFSNNSVSDVEKLHAELQTRFQNLSADLKNRGLL
ncbi:MAG: hypothetical protein LW629_03260 [Burkholderiales bacterium]|nr:hypothetical protein [Burkholderiales bacterium]